MADRSKIDDLAEAITNPKRAEEERKTAQRIGRSGRQAMEWLLRFAQTDLAELSPGQWSDLRAEIELFLRDGPPAGSGGHFSLFALHKQAGGLGELAEVRKESTEGAARLQTTLKAMLTDYLHKGYARLSFDPKGYYEIHRPDAKRPPQFRKAQVQLRAQSFQDIFTYRIVTLLAEHHERIRECQECKRIFLARRGKQELCSRRCLNRVNQRKFQKQKREKAEHRRRH